MKNHRELMRLVQEGARPQITFTAKAEDLESYPEKGMKAIVTGITLQQDDLLKVMLDYAPFDAHNQTLESANYFDKRGVACLTARQYGDYQPQDYVYLMLDTEAAESAISIDDDSRVRLFKRYSEERTQASQTYLTWLEDQVLAST